VTRRRDLERLSEEIEELFSDLWQVPRFSGLRRGFRPEVDCYRTAEPAALTVVVELAGVDPAGVHVDATPQALVIHGERRRPDAHGRVYQQMEIEYGPFQARVPLPPDVDTGAARATYERGLLTIVLPIAQRPPRPVQIPIRIDAP
jgi:HSP20 family protein